MYPTWWLNLTNQQRRQIAVQTCWKPMAAYSIVRAVGIVCHCLWHSTFTLFFWSRQTLCRIKWTSKSEGFSDDVLCTSHSSVSMTNNEQLPFWVILEGAGHCPLASLCTFEQGAYGVLLVRRINWLLNLGSHHVTPCLRPRFETQYILLRGSRIQLNSVAYFAGGGA